MNAKKSSIQKSSIHPQPHTDSLFIWERIELLFSASTSSLSALCKPSKQKIGSINRTLCTLDKNPPRIDAHIDFLSNETAIRVTYYPTTDFIAHLFWRSDDQNPWTTSFAIHKKVEDVEPAKRRLEDLIPRDLCRLFIKLDEKIITEDEAFKIMEMFIADFEIRQKA